MRALNRVALMVASLGLIPACAPAQNPAPLHAPDFRAPEHIAPLYFPAIPNAPFMAIAKTLWVRTLPDGSTITTQNQRFVARDMDGRVFQERRTFTPVPDVNNSQSMVYVQDYTDPVQHLDYGCNIFMKVCNLFAFNGPANIHPIREGLQPDGYTYLTRENLGIVTYEGFAVQRSRETYTHYASTIGNTRTILRTVEYWYSPELGINVKVVRHDPRDGDQTLWLTEINPTAPDPSTFQIPAGFKIIDHRTQPVMSGRAY